MSELKDSGSRREFSTSAVRDVAEGKGRCDLMPLKEIGEMLDDEILGAIGSFIYDPSREYMDFAFVQFCHKRGWTISTALMEVAIHYEDGARKYAERNWEKGIPLHCYIDSGVRHYLKYTRGDKDEPHDRAFLWNILGAIWTLNNKPELNDLPGGCK